MAILLILFGMSPYLQRKAAMAIHGYDEQIVNGSILDVQLQHSDKILSSNYINFKYAFEIAGKQDTASVKQYDNYNPFGYQKLKQQAAKYKTGDNITVYVKPAKHRGYSSYSIFDNRLLAPDTFLFFNFVLLYVICFILSFLIIKLIRRKNGNKNDIWYLSFFLTFLVCIIYSISPYLQSKSFEVTHSSFETIEANINEQLKVRYRRSGGGTRGSTAYYQITGTFEYSYKGKSYTNPTESINLYSFDKKEAANELANRLYIKRYKAYFDPERPEYAVLFLQNDLIYLRGSFLSSVTFLIILGVMLLGTIILFIAKILSPKNKR